MPNKLLRKKIRKIFAKLINEAENTKMFINLVQERVNIIISHSLAVLIISICVQEIFDICSYISLCVYVCVYTPLLCVIC